MSTLVKFVQENPYIILFVFLLGVVGGIISIVSGWELFSQIMEKSIIVPRWAILILAIINLLWFFKSTPVVKQSDLDDPSKYTVITAKTFGDERVILDGKKFYKCNFKGTRIVYMGTNSFQIDDCKMNDVELVWAGPAARTLKSLGDLYRQPSTHGVIKSFIDGLQNGNARQFPPPSDFEY